MTRRTASHDPLPHAPHPSTAPRRHAALGRTPSDLARRALSVALRIDPYDNTESCTIAIEDAAEIAAILREVAAREQGATVPRAGVEALRARWSATARDLAADVKSDPSLRMIEGASKALADVVVALDDLLAAPAKEQP